MAKGLPKKYAKMGFKAGWKAYKAANPTKFKGKQKKKKGGNPKTAKKNNLRRAKSFLNVNTLMKIDRAVAFLAPRARAVMIPTTPHGKLDAYVATVSGYNMANGNWSWDSLVKGWLPYLATSVVSKGIGKINGIIRRL